MVKTLKYLCQKIDKNELISSKLPGFEFPNNFYINQLLEVCSNKLELNRNLCQELCFAINESEYKNIKKLSFYNKLFLIYLLFKCYELYECWFSEEFYLLTIEMTIDSDRKKLEDIYKVLNDIKIELNNKVSVFSFALVSIKNYIAYKLNIIIDINNIEGLKIDDFENSEIKEKFLNIINFSSENAYQSPNKKEIQPSST